ncbi:MAG: phage head closure protein [Kiloniellaceae bacterium]
MIGRLRHRLTIQAENPAADAGGGQGADPWADPITVATVWGRVEPLTGGERLRAMQVQDRLSHRITIRHRPGITPRMRIVFGARVFNVRAVINPEERDRVLELLCEEGVAA